MPYSVLGILDMKQDINLYFYSCGYVNDWRVADEVNVPDFGGHMRTQITYWNKFGVIFPHIHRFCIIGGVVTKDARGCADRQHAQIYLCDKYGTESYNQEVVTADALNSYLTKHFPAGTADSGLRNYMEERVDICVDDASISQFVSSIASNLQLAKLNSRGNSDLQAVVMQRVSSKVRDALNAML